jgi:hypothetical protein
MVIQDCEGMNLNKESCGKTFQLMEEVFFIIGFEEPVLDTKKKVKCYHF